MERENPFNESVESAKPLDVIIIGAGISGLTAAYRLLQLKPNLRIQILEAKDRTGGRVYSAELPARNNTTDVWDLGGCWLGNQNLQPFINQLLADLNIATYQQNFQGKKLLQTGKDYTVTEYDATIPDIGLMSLMDTITLIKHINNTQKKMDITSKTFNKSLLKLDATTAESFIQSKIWTKCTFDCSRAAIRGTLGSELNKLSALYLIAFVNSCGGFFNIVESGESSAQGHKICGGAQRICTRILEIIGADKLKLDTVVTNIEKINDDNDETITLVKTMAGETLKTKFVVTAIPPHLIPNILFHPPLSSNKYEFFSSVAPAHSIKVILTYEKAFWINNGYSGEVVSNGGKSYTKGCDTGPLCIVFDGTTDNKSPALVCFICGQQALQYENKTKSERKEAILTSLETLFKSKIVRDFIVYCEKVWRHEQYIGGCPVCTVPPGVAKYLNSDLRTSENGIYFASSELGEDWMGFMEGAVQSGERAALQIISDSYGH